MLEIPSGIRSSRVLLTGLALFYLLSLWLIAQQYRIPFLADKIDHVTGAKTLSVSGSTADITSAARNATLGVSIRTECR